MSRITEEMDEVRAILKEYDDGHSSPAQCLGDLHALFVGPLLDTLEKGEEYMTFGSCCCSKHEPDRTFKVQFTIQPHGFTAKRCE